MTDEMFHDLKVGDVVKHASNPAQKPMVVTGNYGDHVTAVRSADLTNPSEWMLVSKARHNEVTP